MPDLSAFSPDYRTARDKFRAAARAAGAALDDFVCPAASPTGHARDLTADVAVLGPGDAGRVFLVNAGTHGVEAFAGSALEIAFLAARPALPDDVRLVLVHAINPHGFAGLRRVTEDNVDLNRNFLAHDGSYPANEAYDVLHPLLCPARWDEASLAEIDRTIEAYVERHGRVRAPGRGHARPVRPCGRHLFRRQGARHGRTRPSAPSSTGTWPERARSPSSTCIPGSAPTARRR